MFLFDCLIPAVKTSVELDRHHPRADGTCRVRVMIFHLKRVRIPLDIHVKLSEWTLNRRVKATHPKADLFNRTIETYLNRAQAVILQRPGIGAEELRDALQKPDGGGLQLSLALGAVLKDHASRFSPGSVECFSHVVRLVGEALPEVSITSLSPAHVHRYREHVATGLHQNTVRARLKHFRLLYRHACSTHGIEPANVFKGAIPRELPTAARFLTAEEIAKIQGFETTDPRLALARDAFLLSMYFGGARFGDLCSFAPADIREGVLHYTMVKSRVPRLVPVIPQAQAIIERSGISGRLLPLIEGGRSVSSANASTNELLKRIAYATGVNPALSMHWARHSFANWAVTNEVPVDTIRMILGHSSVRTTEQYLARFDRTRVAEVFGRLSAAMG